MLDVDLLGASLLACFASSSFSPGNGAGDRGNVLILREPAAVVIPPTGKATRDRPVADATCSSHTEK
jgi:hypothetical protein